MSEAGLFAASVTRTSKPCNSEAAKVGESTAARASISGSPRRGTMLGASENTTGFASLSELDSSASPSTGT